MNSEKAKYLSSLHQSALTIVKDLINQEFLMIEILQKIDQNKVYRFLGFKSLYQYAVNGLGLSEARAYNFILVSRKASQIESLQIALKNKEITLSKAKRISSVVNAQNAGDWLEKAKTLSQRNLERAVARVNPKSVVHEGAHFISENILELKVAISIETETQIKRVQDLLCQSQGKAVNLDKTLRAMAQVFLEKKDPLVKAERIIKKKMKKDFLQNQAASQQLVGNGAKCKSKSERELKIDIDGNSNSNSNSNNKAGLVGGSGNAEDKLSGATSPQRPNHKSLRPVNLRLPISQKLKHQIALRDQGQCQGVNPDGSKCGDQRWIDVHHQQPVIKGGMNVIENLLTLCRSHHQMEHQQVCDGYETNAFGL